ncbi:MAG: hypothetical protein ACXAEF_03620 [Candidatus Thorarchaeota archaeon]
MLPIAFPDMAVLLFVLSLGASLSQPFFVAWGIWCMRLREEEISRNLVVAKEYATIEPEKTKYWWKGENSKRYFITHALVWQVLIIPFCILFAYMAFFS